MADNAPLTFVEQALVDALVAVLVEQFTDERREDGLPPDVRKSPGSRLVPDSALCVALVEGK